MEREYVESSMITSVGYDAGTSTLEIEFKGNNQVWQYYDFPENLFYDFKAGSLGNYFNANIKGKYGDTRLE